MLVKIFEKTIVFFLFSPVFTSCSPYPPSFSSIFPVLLFPFPQSHISQGHFVKLIFSKSTWEIYYIGIQSREGNDEIQLISIKLIGHTFNFLTKSPWALILASISLPAPPSRSMCHFVVVYHVAIVAIWHGLLKKFWPMVIGCALRTAASSLIWNYADPLTSLELLF